MLTPHKSYSERPKTYKQTVATLSGHTHFYCFRVSVSFEVEISVRNIFCKACSY